MPTSLGCRVDSAEKSLGLVLLVSVNPIDFGWVRSPPMVTVRRLGLYHTIEVKTVWETSPRRTQRR